MKYAIIDAEGRIVCSRFGPKSVVEAQCHTGQNAVEVADSVSDATHYIKASTGQPNLRDATPCTPSKTTIAADGASSLSLSQMRPGTKVTISGPIPGESIVEEGSLRLTFCEPGEYLITAEAPWPAMPKEIVIRAT